MEPTSSDDNLPQMRRYSLIAAAVLVAAIALFVVWRRHHRRHGRHAAPTSSVAAMTGSSNPVPDRIPEQAAPNGVALELWVKNPEALAAKMLPRLMAPLGQPKPAPSEIPTFATLLASSPDLKDDSRKDVDQIDFNQPLGYVVLEEEPGKPPPKDALGEETSRFVIAAVVKDQVAAAKRIEDFAGREGAVKEHSDVLAIDTYKGAHTGRYLALIGKQVMIGSDRQALELAAPHLRDGLVLATTQAHDLVAHAPRTWISGPFERWAEGAWNKWTIPQLRGATEGPAKAILDEVAASAKGIWPGAEDLDVYLDVGESSAKVTGTLRATPGTAFSKFLEGFPAENATSILGAPRDSLGAMVVHVPAAWVDTIRKFMVTPQPGMDIDAARKADTERIFGQIAAAIDGELMMSTALEPPPYPASTQLFRFRVRDGEQAKKAISDFMHMLIPPEMPPAILSVEGGTGEAYEDVPQVGPGDPPAPPVGLAWVVREKYAYVVSGMSPKARVLRFASSKVEDHLESDRELVEHISAYPTRTAFALLAAPLRPETPFSKLAGVPPSEQAMMIALDPEATGLVLAGDFDLDLLAEVVRPLVLRPMPGAPGSDQGVPPGGATGVPGMPGMPGMPVPGVPGGPGTGKPPIKPGKPVDTGAPTGKPVGPLVVPPAPTGYVLPLPKPGGGGDR